MVAIVYDRRTMGDKDYRLLPMTKDIFQQKTLGVWVERTGGLIEEHDAARPKEGAGYGNALGLSFTETASLLGKHGVKTVGQAVDKVGAGSPQGRHHLIVSSIRPS